MKIVTMLLAALLLLAGCSGSSDDEVKPAPSASPSSTSTSDLADATQKAQDELAKKVDEKADEVKAEGTDVEITIKDGKVTPQGARVEVAAGKPVTLLVTSDVDEEIHVHSDPEHTYQVTAGGSIEKTFTIDRPGQVAVEAHGLGVTIVQLVVR
ncbi:cupredoxin domain-containing protein [Aeromicrobium fastidiosum]|uniref:EfeO-type cupredoxin-like domain-containing protein n=1 Tax=Aeromicrobium fastidiosum TaxID=52699 RepID=A0A641APZ7_9ACTN|nr:hypothetical protein [Aeromicrobium fastidiosum]KAA1379752.1 hypothetical protein ESP62_000595 [Aeromicrobium fastidiosum]MBP2389240.1 plastocyanin [Aeromicrobium fastidiosum]